jgi:hypothetical protein
VRSLARAGHPPDLVLFYSSVLAQSPGSPPGGGAASGVDPPVPIPNTVVKRSSADDTAWATAWDNRPVPGPSLTLFCSISYNSLHSDAGWSSGSSSGS